MDIEKIKDLKILFVEDEDEIIETTCSSLKRFIPNVEIAVNGEEGLEMFFSNKENKAYDLIITDLAMPYMDGVEMIKRIREKDNIIPIIVTTAYGSQSKNIEELPKYNIKEYVMKPVDMAKLLEAIESCV